MSQDERAEKEQQQAIYYSLLSVCAKHGLTFSELVVAIGRMVVDMPEFAKHGKHREQAK